jgi:hypothetical protein
MAKNTVYSWRLSPARKALLEQVARERATSIADVLDRATDDYIRSFRARGGESDLEQARLHSAVAGFIGTVRGGDPSRASEAGVRVKAKLGRQRGR